MRAPGLRALAIGGDQRKPGLPDVPTAAELGMPGLVGTAWLGFVVPAGTPPAVIARLQREIAAAAQAPDYREALAQLGAELLVDTPEAFGRYIEAETPAVERGGAAGGGAAGLTRGRPFHRDLR
jgi:tripartite-type tricarboxylate transporter receptor subunit TctC